MQQMILKREFCYVLYYEHTDLELKLIFEKLLEKVTFNFLFPNIENNEFISLCALVHLNCQQSFLEST